MPGKMIPDPGNKPASGTWLNDNMPHGTPETAKPEGVVTSTPFYIEGDADKQTGNFFFVFKTGPAYTSFSVLLNEVTSMIDMVHLHDGAGLIFGAEVAPAMVTSELQKTWTVQPNHVYVLEIHSPGGGFF